MKPLTQEDAVTAFAKAWNRLEPDRHLALLAPDARCASQWVSEELVGAVAISNYLRGKMRTVRSHGVNHPNWRVQVEVGRTAWGDEGRPCAFMTQGNEVQAAVIFETRDGKVSRYDLCIPQILGAVRTGGVSGLSAAQGAMQFPLRHGRRQVPYTELQTRPMRRKQGYRGCDRGTKRGIDEKTSLAKPLKINWLR